MARTLNESGSEAMQLPRQQQALLSVCLLQITRIVFLVPAEEEMLKFLCAYGQGFTCFPFP
jgi:hypothetical protein